MSGCGGHDDEHVNVICEAAHSRMHHPATLPAHIIAKLDALWADLAEHWDLCAACFFPVEGCPCVARERKQDQGSDLFQLAVGITQSYARALKRGDK